jgi:uncharacterized membrane protein YcaP (DUF421 family)
VIEPLVPHLLSARGDVLTVIVTALRVVVVYLVVLGLLHLSGRRLLGQMTPFDLLTLLLIANVVQNAMVGPDVSLTGGLLGAVVLLALNRWVAGTRWLRGHLELAPAILVYQGKVNQALLEAEGVSLADLEAAAREHGLAELSKVETAVLEMDGTVSIIATEQVRPERLHRVKSARKRQR